MHRTSILLLCCALAVAVVAAPAPLHRPAKASGMWTNAWDRPVDPAGDCRFDRAGGKLTITVPGKGHDFDVAPGRLNGPRLQREVKGDFVMHARVGASCSPVKSGLRRAGVFLTDGRMFLRCLRIVSLPAGQESRVCLTKGFWDRI